MGTCTGLDADQTGRQRGKELHKLGAPDLPADGNPALGINGMDLKHRFGEVQANCCDLSHDLRSLSSALNGLILAPSGAGAIHPIVWEQFLFRPLVRNWGRIGTNGQELVEVFASEVEAGQALEVIARLKRRRGDRDL
jgi:hypothetical protein